MGYCSLPVSRHVAFEKPRRRRLGKRRLKMNFPYESCDTLKSFTKFITVKTVTKLNLKHSDKSIIKGLKNEPLLFTLSRQHRLWSFHFVVLQRTVKKCAKDYNARAQLLFCSFTFCSVPLSLPSWICKGPFTQAIFVAATRCNFCRVKIASSFKHVRNSCDIAATNRTKNCTWFSRAILKLQPWARQKLHRVAATKIACVNGPLQRRSAEESVGWCTS